MKVCKRCNQSKQLSEFSKNPNKKDGHNYTCKKCSNEYFKEYYRNNTASVRERNKKQDKLYKERVQLILRTAFVNGCVNCGELDIRTLEFAHIKRSTKKFSIATAVAKQWSIDKIKREIQKCKVLCANCHRKETHQEINSWRSLDIPVSVEPIRHNTANSIPPVAHR